MATRAKETTKKTHMRMRTRFRVASSRYTLHLCNRFAIVVPAQHKSESGTVSVVTLAIHFIVSLEMPLYTFA